MKLTNRTVLVTGGSRGIGLCLAEELLKGENTVIITGRNSESLEKAKKRFPKLIVRSNDVASLESIEELAEWVKVEHSSLDVLVNNAGISQMIDLRKETADDKLMSEIEINFKGAVRMANALLPVLLRRPEAAIVNVSSGLAYMPFVSNPIYSATKAALHSYSLSLRSQLRKTKVKVFEVLPPVVETDMTSELSGLPKMHPTKHAKIVIKQMEKGKDEIRPGITEPLHIMSRLAPRFTLSQINR